jgi:hypothetical protein
MSYFLENLDILSKKFPFLYLLFISKINTNVPSISKPNQIELNIKDFDVVFIYKCLLDPSSFEEINKWLLNEGKRLYFFEDDLSNLRSFFRTKIANDLLKNEKVSFHFFSKTDQLIEQITPDIRTKKIKVITFANETTHFLFLKKEILQHSLISYFANHDRIYSYKIFKNFYSNLDRLKFSFLVNKFKNKFKDKPAIVLGAGPSLKYSFEILKRLQNKALFIAGGSAITCLSKMNILPHLGVIIDPNFDEYERMKESNSFEIPMIYSTRVNSGVFKTFNGPPGYLKAEICGFFEVWLDEELKISYKSLPANNLVKALTVTTVSLMIARLLGCNPIILDGIDLAYSQNQRYSIDIIKNNKLNENEGFHNENYLFKDKNNKEVYTNLFWEIEKEWIASFASENKNIKFFNSTKDGLKIDGINDLALCEVEKTYLKDQFDYKSYIHFLIQNNMIKNAQKKDFSLMKSSLIKSFERCEKYFQQIIDNNPEYNAILAKEEILNEIAYKYFLMECEFTLNKFYNNSSNFSKLKEICKFFIDECKKEESLQI